MKILGKIMNHHDELYWNSDRNKNRQCITGVTVAQPINFLFLNQINQILRLCMKNPGILNLLLNTSKSNMITIT